MLTFGSPPTAILHLVTQISATCRVFSLLQLNLFCTSLGCSFSFFGLRGCLCYSALLMVISQLINTITSKRVKILALRIFQNKHSHFGGKGESLGDKVQASKWLLEWTQVYYGGKKNWLILPCLSSAFMFHQSLCDQYVSLNTDRL